MRYLLLLLLCAIAATPGLAAAQTRSYVFERVEVELDLGADGALEVVERYTYRFTGGPFQRALRGIPREGVDAIRDVRLSEDGQEYRAAFRGEEPGTYIVENNADELLVRWFYPPTSDAARTFTLSYTVDGAVYVGEGYDELWWVAVFPERDVPVERSRVTLRLPEGAALGAEDLNLTGAEADAQVRPEQVTLARDEPLAPGEALELRVELDPGLIDAPAPDWQQQGDAPPAQGPAAPADPFPGAQPSSEGAGFDLIFCLFCLIILIVLIFVLLPLLRRLSGGSGGGPSWGGGPGWGGGYGGGGGWGGGWGGGPSRGGGWGGWGGDSGGSGGRSSSGWGRGNRSGGSWGGGRSAGSFGGGRSGGSWGGGRRSGGGGRSGGRRSGGGRGGAG